MESIECMSKSDLHLMSQAIAEKANTLFGNKVRNLVLYGSFARGDYDSESDIDFMLLIDLPQIELAKYRHEINELSSSLSLDYDITVSIKLKDYNIVSQYKDSVSFYKNVFAEGVFINV